MKMLQGVLWMLLFMGGAAIAKDVNAPLMYHYNTGKCKKCRQILSSCSPVLSKWFRREQKHDPSVHIATAYRGLKDQERVLKARSSDVGWGKSAHNYKPCLAVDLCFYVDGKSKQIPAKYRTMVKRMPSTVENGSMWTRLVDWCHFQVNGWQTYAKNYPNGNE